MAEPRVIFDGVWKKFRRGERHDSLRDLIPATASRLFRRRRDDELGEQEFWAVEDVSFEVKPGEALGIIGPNGAGKSTTLKLLTRILRPTRGRCEVRGRVGALIEVAAGFHPDLTGRENIFLQGAIMGMKRAEIARRCDEIIEFAGVGEFVDTQVKRYSSGMNARLGFAIAAHLEPEALIIDEVLSVGDMAFQRKCVDRMASFKQQGVSIVFVSHDLPAVGRLCDEVLLLSRKPLARGAADEVLAAYGALAFGAKGGDSDNATITAGPLELDGRTLDTAVVPGTKLHLDVEVVLDASVSDLALGIAVHRSTDLAVAYEALFELGSVLGGERRFRRTVSFTANLTRGHYLIELQLAHRSSMRYLAKLMPAADFRVEELQSWRGLAELGVRVDGPASSHEDARR